MAHTLVKDVSEADFTQVVVEGSKTRPVVVDFWAEWCGPCHQLSPLLEQAAERFAGEVDVVKVNVDQNPRLAQSFRVQGIPAVKGFADGRMVSEFTGVQPPQAIEQFFSALAPSKADKLVAAAQIAADSTTRESLLRDALTQEADHPGAAVGLAEVLTTRGEIDDALAVLARAQPTPEVQQAAAQLRLSGSSSGGSLEELRAAVDSGDDEARVALGSALAAAGRHEEAVAVLLDAVRVPATREPAREALLEIFTALGSAHTVVKTARPKLAAALF